MTIFLLSWSETVGRRSKVWMHLCSFGVEYLPIEYRTNYNLRRRLRDLWNRERNSEIENVTCLVARACRGGCLLWWSLRRHGMWLGASRAHPANPRESTPLLVPRVVDFCNPRARCILPPSHKRKPASAVLPKQRVCAFGILFRLHVPRDAVHPPKSPAEG